MIGCAHVLLAITSLDLAGAVPHCLWPHADVFYCTPCEYAAQKYAHKDYACSSSARHTTNDGCAARM